MGTMLVLVLFLLLPPLALTKHAPTRTKKEQPTLRSRKLLPEEVTPLETLKDPEGRFLGFYEDNDKRPTKFHYYYSMWEVDEQRDGIIRRNNRHTVENLDVKEVAIVANEDNQSILIVFYIFGIGLTWVPYAISVLIQVIQRRAQKRRRARESAAAAERLAAKRASEPPPPPPAEHAPPPPESHHHPRPSKSNIKHPSIVPPQDGQKKPEFKEFMRKFSKVTFDINKTISSKTKGIRDTVTKLIFSSNRVGPAGDRQNKHVLNDDPPLSDDESKQDDGSVGECRVEVEKLSGVGWAESENEGDVDTAESSSDDEGSMWNYWKKLRRRSSKTKPAEQQEAYGLEDPTKYCTNTLW